MKTITYKWCKFYRFENSGNIYYNFFFPDILDYLMYLSEHYPHLVELLPIGKTVEGRPLKVVKISSGQTRENVVKPAIWIDGGTTRCNYNLYLYLWLTFKEDLYVEKKSILNNNRLITTISRSALLRVIYRLRLIAVVFEQNLFLKIP